MCVFVAAEMSIKQTLYKIRRENALKLFLTFVAKKRQVDGLGDKHVHSTIRMPQILTLKHKYSLYCL